MIVLLPVLWRVCGWVGSWVFVWLPCSVVVFAKDRFQGFLCSEVVGSSCL